MDAPPGVPSASDGESDLSGDDSDSDSASSGDDDPSASIGVHRLRLRPEFCRPDEPCALSWCGVRRHSRGGADTLPGTSDAPCLCSRMSF
jgi:hypothetical protein